MMTLDVRHAQVRVDPPLKGWAWPARLRGLRGARGGYSFPEVMFAVVVLGIGFIMLAAVFPVAIKQSKLTIDETRGVSIGREAAGIVLQLAKNTDAKQVDYQRATKLPYQDPNYSGNGKMPSSISNGIPSGDGLPLHIGMSLFPPTGQNYSKPKRVGSPPAPGVVRPIWTQFGWDVLRGNLILPTDRRYGWTILYRRDGDPDDDPNSWSPLVHLYIFIAQPRTRDLFDISGDGPDVGQWWVKATTIGAGTDFPLAIDAPTPMSDANLYPRFVNVKFTNDYKGNGTGVGPDKMEVVSPAAPSTPDALAEGAFVVTEGELNPPLTNLVNTNQPGRVYRLGNRIQGTNKVEFELLPGNDMVDNTENTIGSSEWVMVLGREYDPVAKVFKGAAQDIYLYTAIIGLK